MNSSMSKLTREIAAAYEYQGQLEAQTQSMKEDPAYVERIARDQLNMGKPGETVIRFDKYQATPPPANAHPSRDTSDDRIVPAVRFTLRIGK